MIPRGAGARARAAAFLIVVSAPLDTGVTVGRTVQAQPISGASPFRHECGYQYRAVTGAAGEPQIAVNPVDPRNILVFHQQDRRPGNVGGAVANALRVSRDGGRTWRLVLIPGSTRCGGGPLEAASDPWVSFGPDGSAYAIENTYMLRPAQLQKRFGSAHGVRVSVSRDGGSHWSRLTVLASDSPLTTTDADKPAVTADPLRAGVAYATWFEDTLQSATVRFAETADAGRSWSAPTAVYALPGDLKAAFGWGSQIVPLGHGRLLAVFELGPVRGGRDQVLAARSVDAGRTWSEPLLIASVHDRQPFDPDTQQTIRTVPGGPSVAIDGRGSVYVVYEDIRGPHSGPILLSRSTNRGRTFTRPRAVIIGRTQHFTATIAARANGALGLTFYDFRHDRRHDHQLTTDYWYAASRDNGRHWRQIHLGGPFDALTAPIASRSTGPSGHFLGEYQGLIPAAGGFDAAFTLARPAARRSPSAIFFAHIPA
jgi:hypothetical protein